ncbi:LuxR family transcriptional regulator [Bartonella sp. LJL80]
MLEKFEFRSDTAQIMGFYPLLISDLQVLREKCMELTTFFNLQNITYFCINDNGLKTEEPVVITTYSQKWQDYYRQNEFYLYDPVLYQTFEQVLPTDWRDFEMRSAKIKEIMTASREFGVGDYGLSIPLRGPRSERAIVSITHDGNARTWERLKSVYMKDFMIIAQLIHATALNLKKSNSRIESDMHLGMTPRELHCLYWASQGKTTHETAIIMGISQNTVRAYIESARRELNATSIAHAVSKAIQLNLMPVYLKP